MRGMGGLTKSVSGKTAGALMVIFTLGMLASCGQRIEAPEENPWNKELPLPDSYVFNYERIGFETATDLELARGGLLYIASADGVTPYYQDVLRGPGWTFDGIIDPVVVSEAPDGHILVADRGDMNVKVFESDGGSPVVTFTDSDWAAFGGLAADDSGTIFVADREMSFVRAYLPDGTPKFTEDIADSGFGLGHVIQPHGLYYDGRYLWIADTGKNWIQEVNPDSVQLGLRFLDGYTYEDEEGNEVKLPFSAPVDVATDTDGFVYVTDQGNRRIFKFTQEDLAPFTTVNYDTSAGQPPHLRAMGVNNKSVFAIDDSLGSILVWDLK